MTNTFLGGFNDTRRDIFAEVLALLDSEIEKAKDRGDLTTAETIEVIRAKVKAKETAP